jgi:sec-independent protein translocase protein TatC
VPRIKPITHEDRLSVVEHLDELRSRLIVIAFAFLVAFSLCFWQNHRLLKIVNDPLPHGIKPITLSPAESFTTTMTVSAYFALLICLPVLLYELYAFVLPAFTPTEKKVAFPLLMLIPLLFIAGVVFGYYIVIPAAIKFLLNFNDQQFNIQIRAREYYSFVSLTLIAMGAVFQIPVGILAATRLGLTTPHKLRKNRRYAFLIISVVAAALPGVDPVSMLIEMVPLLVLYELSILLASAFGRPSAEVGEQLASAEGSS